MEPDYFFWLSVTTYFYSTLTRKNGIAIYTENYKGLKSVITEELFFFFVAAVTK
jgi:hypothetical protein